MRRVRTVFSGVAGSPYYSNLFFLNSGVSLQTQIDAVAQFWNDMDLLITSDCTWTVEAQAAVIESTTGLLVDVEQGTAVNGAGGAAGASLPSATQLCINWHTGLFVSGRELRGKTFVPSLSTTVNSDGVPIASAISTAEAAGTALSQGSDLIVFSRTHFAQEFVTGVAVMNQFAVLRSRRD